MSSVEPFLARTHIAYFSMEMAVRPEMHTYAGGLGVLAGDTARSCADLELPVVFVTLLSRAGYFRQQIDADGQQVEHPDWWEPERCVRRLMQWSPLRSSRSRCGSVLGSTFTAARMAIRSRSSSSMQILTKTASKIAP